MTTVTAVSYSLDVKVAANTALRDSIDGGTGAGSIKIRDSSDVLLAEMPLSDPCGSVDVGTGVLTLSVAGNEATPTAGTAEYGEVCDSDDNVKIIMPVQEGGSAVAGYLVIDSTTILEDTIVSIASATVG